MECSILPPPGRKNKKKFGFFLFVVFFFNFSPATRRTCRAFSGSRSCAGDLLQYSLGGDGDLWDCKLAYLTNLGKKITEQAIKPQKTQLQTQHLVKPVATFKETQKI